MKYNVIRFKSKVIITRYQESIFHDRIFTETYILNLKNLLRFQNPITKGFSDPSIEENATLLFKHTLFSHKDVTRLSKVYLNHLLDGGLFDTYETSETKRIIQIFEDDLSSFLPTNALDNRTSLYRQHAKLYGNLTFAYDYLINNKNYLDDAHNLDKLLFIPNGDTDVFTIIRNTQVITLTVSISEEVTNLQIGIKVTRRNKTNRQSTNSTYKPTVLYSNYHYIDLLPLIIDKDMKTIQSRIKTIIKGYKSTKMEFNEDTRLNEYVFTDFNQPDASSNTQNQENQEKTQKEKNAELFDLLLQFDPNAQSNILKDTQSSIKQVTDELETTNLPKLFGQEAKPLCSLIELKLKNAHRSVYPEATIVDTEVKVTDTLIKDFITK